MVNQQRLLAAKNRMIELKQVVARRTAPLRTPAVRRAFGLALNLAVLALLGLVLYQNRTDLPLVWRLLSVRLVAICALYYGGSFLIQLLIWASLTGFRATEWHAVIEQYVRTNFMARLPGSVWKIVGRMTVYRAEHITPPAALAISLVEMLLLLLAAGALVLLATPLEWPLQLAGTLALVAAGLLVRWRTRSYLPGQPTATHWLVWCGGYMVAWCCGGLMVYTITNTLGNTHLLTLAQAIQCWCIAGATGIILQVLPVSALLRDGTIVVQLQTVMPLHLALVAALTLRLLLTAFEVTFGWLLLGVLRLTRQD